MANIEKRSSQDGSVTFRVKIRIKGFPAQTASFNRLTDAKRWAQNIETEIRQGRYFKSSEAKRHTLGNAIERYIKSVIPQKPKSKKDQLIHLKWWKNKLGEYTLADITPAIIAEHRDLLTQEKVSRNKNRSGATANRYLAVLSHLFTIALKEWGWVEENPVRKIIRLKEPRGRVRYLSDDERERLLQMCRENDNSYLYILVVLALSTGARKMEILNLHWQNIDLERCTIILNETKNGERRALPLVDHAHQLMLQLAKNRCLKTDFVFPSHDKTKPMDIRTPWETILKRANITDFRFHDLRHSAASYLAMNGASLSEIAEILGHKSLQMVKRYAHLSQAHVSKVVAKMNEHIFKSRMN